MHIIEHFEQREDHCVIFDSFKCTIYCQQCEIEITDLKGETFSHQNKSSIFNFRRMFFPKNELRKEDQRFPNYSFEKCCFPLQFLQQSLAMLYGNDYLRTTLRMLHANHSYVTKNFKKKIYPKVIRMVSKIIFNFDNKTDVAETFEKLYFNLISKDKRLATYSNENFGVN
jgi:hypothetical protein